MTSDVEVDASVEEAMVPARPFDAKDRSST